MSLNCLTTTVGSGTSATAMAADVMIDELEALIAQGRSAAMATPVATAAAPADPVYAALSNDDDDDDTPGEIARARQARIDAAKQFLMDDISGANSGDDRQAPGRHDPMQDVMFGRGGIGGRNDEEDMYPEGMDPDSFF
jgi:hypothetical protein